MPGPADVFIRLSIGSQSAQLMIETSTKPYLLRAIYEWCTDNGFTPYIAAAVDGRTVVPREFVKNGEIVLNVSFGATNGLKMDNALIHFHARFGGVSREISIPVENVLAIYARENGQGMAFEVSKSGTSNDAASSDVPQGNAPAAPTLSAVPAVDINKTADLSPNSGEKDPEPPKKGGKPTLTRVK